MTIMANTLVAPLNPMSTLSKTTAVRAQKIALRSGSLTGGSSSRSSSMTSGTDGGGSSGKKSRGVKSKFLRALNGSATSKTLGGGGKEKTPKRSNTLECISLGEIRPSLEPLKDAPAMGSSSLAMMSSELKEGKMFVMSRRSTMEDVDSETDDEECDEMYYAEPPSAQPSSGEDNTGGEDNAADGEGGGGSAAAQNNNNSAKNYPNRRASMPNITDDDDGGDDEFKVNKSDWTRRRHSMEDEIDPERAGRRLGFHETVEVVTVPHHEDYSEKVREMLWGRPGNEDEEKDKKKDDSLWWLMDD